MKKVVITGANRGIGLATAKKFLEERFFVVGTSRSGSIDAIKEGNFDVIKADFSFPHAIEAAANELLSKHGEIDVLVNCAGVLLDLHDTAVNMEKLRSTLEVNLFGLIDFAERIVPSINEGGHIINVSSSMGTLTGPLIGSYSPAYKISKTALNMYTKTLADRLRSKSIIVSSICPGWVKTDMGGPDAQRDPAEAAKDIFELATSDVETGQFWSEGHKKAW